MLFEKDTFVDQKFIVEIFLVPGLSIVLARITQFRKQNTKEAQYSLK